MLRGALALCHTRYTHAARTAHKPTNTQIRNTHKHAQDLVAARVQLEAMGRKLELAERERARAAATLHETQVRTLPSL